MCLCSLVIMVSGFVFIFLCHLECICLSNRGSLVASLGKYGTGPGAPYQSAPVPSPATSPSPVPAPRSGAGGRPWEVEAPVSSPRASGFPGLDVVC